MFHYLIFILVITRSNGELPDTNKLEVSTRIPILSPLLTKMLQSSGYGAELPVRQVATNFTLLPDEMLKFAQMTKMDEFQKLLSPIMIPRTIGSDGHQKVEEFIKTTLKDLNFHVELDEFEDKTPDGPKTFRNIIGTYSMEAKKRFVLACHYDSKILEEEVFIGATDSAAPCAMILDLAKTLELLLKKQQNPPVTLQLVFFDGEEAFGNWTDDDSLYGSRHLAKVWSQKRWGQKTELDRINALMLLDLLGAAKPSIAHTVGHGTKHLFDKLLEIETHLNNTGHLHKADKMFHPFEIAGPIGDDHQPFRDRRVPIMHLISFVFPEQWHTVKDNAEALDMNTIQNFLSILRPFVGAYLGLKT